MILAQYAIMWYWNSNLKWPLQVYGEIRKLTDLRRNYSIKVLLNLEKYNYVLYDNVSLRKKMWMASIHQINNIKLSKVELSSLLLGSNWQVWAKFPRQNVRVIHCERLNERGVEWEGRDEYRFRSLNKLFSYLGRRYCWSVQIFRAWNPLMPSRFCWGGLKF